MISTLSISGMWQFLDDQKEQYTGFPPKAEAFRDFMPLPSTTEISKKGEYNTKRETGFLTQTYPYLGNAWFMRKISIPKHVRGKRMQLFLERTRITSVWVNGTYIGSQNSLCTPHCYDISGFSNAESITICLCVNNRHYPTAGGHMTSKDTQTNWNGITGEISLRFFDLNYICSVKAHPDARKKTVTLELRTEGTINMVKVTGQWETLEAPAKEMPSQILPVLRTKDGKAYLKILLLDHAPLWDEYHPTIGRLWLSPYGSEDLTEVCFGLTDFKAEHHQFTNHGKSVFLRGKHDGMIFPLTGAAPTTLEEWLHVMGTAKEYGINHYRFHTCCPPDAAFTAADLLGIYMEPEVPFWGTVNAPEEEDFRPEEQSYLIAEGRRILEAFGNHPSFAMFSLGNELWGNPQRIGEILRYYKQEEKRILFTQGCNNFQHWPNILPEDDFFVGVRLSKERLIRGSYATCDIPLGHVQTEYPSTMHDYDNVILPQQDASEDRETPSEIEIQYGTGVRKVHVEQTTGGLIPEIPVITHEIGQYCVYPNLKETLKYTGVLQARNFDIFRERLAEKGMEEQAESFFQCSGKLAVQCYKEELEAAIRSRYVSGFQILDIQDFTGQGTATVGILDAFMDSKGLVTPEQWRGFCSDSVILARFPDYVLTNRFSADIQLRHCAPFPVTEPMHYVVQRGRNIVADGTLDVSVNTQGLFNIGHLSVDLPPASRVHKIRLTLSLPHTQNTYTLWQYPVQEMPLMTSRPALCITEDWCEAETKLANGERVLYFPQHLTASVPGFYCSDFWCYPMFREITQSMGKPIPVGTLGLCIQKEHPALQEFRCERWSTPQWYHIVSHADCAILDDVLLHPIVQMIDNFERNHKLGIVFECSVGTGKLLVCTARLLEISEHPEAAQLAKSLIGYAVSNAFLPETRLTLQQLSALFGKPEA